MVRGVIFDMDGVIMDSMPSHFEAWAEAFRQKNITVSKLDIYKREGEQGRITAKEILEKNHQSSSSENIRKLLSAKERIFNGLSRADFFPHAENCVTQFFQKGLLLGLVTGTSRPEVEKLLPKTFRKYFHVIVTGTDVSFGKPHPEPYQKAVKALDLPAREIVVIENAPYGIRSAKQAGLSCIALTTSLPARYLANADWIKDTLSEAKSLIHDLQKRTPRPT